MGKQNIPRRGSMQFWPRKRAKRIVARINSWPNHDKPKLLGFAGYKVGMTHVMFNDARPNSRTKGQDVSMPVTIIECPPLKVLSAVFYHSVKNKQCVLSQVNSTTDKEILRKITKIKKESKSIDDINKDEITDVRLLVYTQPKLTGIGKKSPDVFEMALGGKLEEKIAYAKEVLGKTIPVEEVVEPGQQMDIHAVTKGKGFQGPVRRFGIGLTSHKAEKARRNPGSLGGWKSQGKVMYRVAHAGQTGFHQRTELNKWVLKVDSKPALVNKSGGFKRYGEVKNSYILLKGSVSGPVKRIVKFTYSTWPDRKLPHEAPDLSYISTESHQGR